jgi:hypothetical protein
MDKRYQVFVSSTYLDLIEERRSVIQAVIEMSCIPAGMELFPAADEEQFQFIKSVIDDCDYYLLIIGGRYGSVTSEGISYTEKEYDYAISLQLKVIALIHENPDEIPFGKSEKDPQLREKLEAFKAKVKTGRIVKLWKSPELLPGLVTSSLFQTIKAFPAVGWVRANKAASVDVLTEINDLRKQNAELQAILGKPKPTIENLAGLEDKVNLWGTYRENIYSGAAVWNVTYTWGEIFGLLSPYMISHPTDEFVKGTLKAAAFARSRSHGDNSELDDQIFRTVAIQLQALGLVNLEYSPTTLGGRALFWSNSPAGDRLMMELRTMKKVAVKSAAAGPPADGEQNG